MKKTIRTFTIMLALMTAAFCPLVAQPLTGREVMEKADAVPEPDTSSFKATMTLTDKNGKNRIREVLMKDKDYGDVKKSLIVFTTPKDVAGVGYLTFDYEQKGKDDDSWLYMPAFKKVRRIAGSAKDDYFMGTDFTFDDVGGEREIDDYDYTLLGEEAVTGTQCYKIECRNKNPSVRNPRQTVWIGKENFILYKAEFFDRQDMKQRELECAEIGIVDGYWTTRKMIMKNVQSGHTTLLEITDIAYNENLSDAIFTQGALERGSIK